LLQLDIRRLHPRHWNPRVLWDLFMIWMALANLSLILFDLTYLFFRPEYVRYVPVVTRIYDPVLGIEPHPLTEELMAAASETRQLLELDPDAPGLRNRVDRLRRLTLRTVLENPFDRSGQTRTLEAFKALAARELDGPDLNMTTDLSIVAAVDEFWPYDASVLERRLDLFDANLRPLLEINYYREVDTRGRPVDWFWLLDLPFLTLFLAEFTIRWALAVRRKTYPRWFFFPIFHWYDLIGLIPLTQFRIFRLFRVASIYMRLRRSEASRVGRDVLSRAVAYVSNIIAEEISDVVALRILSETQDEIRDGTHKRIYERTILSRQEELEEVAVKQIRQLVSSEDVQERVRGLMRMNLETAVERSDALRSIPLPSAVLRPLVRGIGEIVLESTLQTAHATLESEEGRQALRDLVGSVLQQMLTGPWRAEVESLSEEISLDVIDHMKAAVSVKKWARPTEEAPVAADDGGQGSEPT
jgi:hypothetical protein